MTTIAKRYSGHDGLVFETVDTFLEDNDPWIKYKNQQTQQEYTCRQEAFLARFSPLPE